MTGRNAHTLSACLDVGGKNTGNQVIAFAQASMGNTPIVDELSHGRILWRRMLINGLYSRNQDGLVKYNAHAMKISFRRAPPAVNLNPKL
jgi:hypothetical protein